jgi:hypothetical protein
MNLENRLKIIDLHYMSAFQPSTLIKKHAVTSRIIEAEQFFSIESRFGLSLQRGI